MYIDVSEMYVLYQAEMCFQIFHHMFEFLTISLKNPKCVLFFGHTFTFE